MPPASIKRPSRSWPQGSTADATTQKSIYPNIVEKQYFIEVREKRFSCPYLVPRSPRRLPMRCGAARDPGLRYRSPDHIGMNGKHTGPGFGQAQDGLPFASEKRVVRAGANL